MTQQIRKHGAYDHLPSGGDALPWLGEYALPDGFPSGGSPGINMIGTVANMPNPSLGTQSGADGVISGGGATFTSATGRFTANDSGTTLMIVDTDASAAPFTYEMTATYVSATELSLSPSYGGSATATLPWVLSGREPSNAGLTYYATDATDTPTGVLYQSQGTDWIPVASPGSTGSLGSYLDYTREAGTGLIGAGASYDMVGLGQLANYTGTPVGCLFTPTGSGRVVCVASHATFYANSDPTPGLNPFHADIDLVFGTGTPPAEGDSFLTSGGTVITGSDVAAVVVGQQVPFTVAGIVDLTVGVEYWFDLAVQSADTINGNRILVGTMTIFEIATGGTGGAGTVTDVTSDDGSITVTDPTSTPDLSVTDSPSVGGITVTGTPSSGEVLTATSSTAADWEAPSGGSLTVTDGSTTVTDATEIDFTAGATITDGGGGVAEVSISGGFTGWTEDAADPANVNTNGGSLTADDGSSGAEILSNAISVASDSTSEGYLFGIGSGYQSFPPSGIAAFTAGDVSLGATVAFDGGGLTIENSPIGASIAIVTVQTGAPSTYETPLVYDNTSVTGGLYGWDGAAYQKIGGLV